MDSSTGRIKVNVDGSKEGDLGLADYGRAIRDKECSWIKGFKGQIGHSSILEAELWATHRILVTLYEDNRRDALMETDSQEAINYIQAQYLKPPTILTLITEIQGLIQSSNCELTHILRECNQVADSLARMGRNQNEIIVIIDIPPAEFASLIIDNIVENGNM